jgi:hypothetical protein
MSVYELNDLQVERVRIDKLKMITVRIVDAMVPDP